ncbi:MAG: hypothetical protein WEB03_13570 [Nitriliruptor sp.]|uniref:hypothetical protein n=1 Tax=Nitriliruptor sp. TaxID=2448056 RepID=UPI0034A0AD18
MAAPVRHLVLDNEAVSALLATTSQHAKRAQVLEAIMSANGRTVVPTAVRCEALWDRTQHVAAAANLHVREDDPLDPDAANRNVQLRKAVPAASLVDASVVVSAERLRDGGVVEVLTSDPGDIAALAGHADVPIDLRTL